MDLFKRFVFEQTFNRNIHAVAGEEQAETIQCFEHRPYGSVFLNTTRFQSRFPPPRPEACLPKPPRTSSSFRETVECQI